MHTDKHKTKQIKSVRPSKRRIGKRTEFVPVLFKQVEPLNQSEKNVTPGL
jgi:hypothetical protein